MALEYLRALPNLSFPLTHEEFVLKHCMDLSTLSSVTTDDLAKHHFSFAQERQNAPLLNSEPQICYVDLNLMTLPPSEFIVTEITLQFQTDRDPISWSVRGGPDQSGDPVNHLLSALEERSGNKLIVCSNSTLVLQSVVMECFDETQRERFFKVALRACDTKLLLQVRDSPNSYQDFIRISLPVSITCLFSTWQDIGDSF
jgi:hypothetical protein